MAAEDRDVTGDGARPTPDLTVLVPVWNEAENLAPLLEKLEQDLAALGLDSEILIIDDGSTDGTPAALRSPRERHPSPLAISLRRNFGKSAALSVGFR
jgi:polyisoprenyl-phosphate glycosyltransferase